MICSKGKEFSNTLYLIVVPSVEDDPHDQEGWVLVGPGVPQQVHPLGVELGEEVGRGGVHHRHPHQVVRGHPEDGVALHLEAAVLKGSHGVHPGLLR